jgi:hypothetical protein
MLVLLAVEQVPSRRVLGSCHQSGFLGRAIAARAIKAWAIEAWAIKAGVIEVDSGVVLSRWVRVHRAYPNDPSTTATQIPLMTRITASRIHDFFVEDSHNFFMEDFHEAPIGCLA